VTALELKLKFSLALDDCLKSEKVTIPEIREMHRQILEIFDLARREADCSHKAIHGAVCFDCGRRVADIPAKELP
jgi:hypothetical protein